MSAAPAVVPPYTDQPPTVAGWYWRREHGRARVVQLLGPDHAPRHWQTMRRDVLNTARDLKTDPAALAHLEALPASHWLIEWAGPIPEPTP